MIIALILLVLAALIVFVCTHLLPICVVFSCIAMLTILMTPAKRRARR